MNPRLLSYQPELDLFETAGGSTGPLARTEMQAAAELLEAHDTAAVERWLARRVTNPADRDRDPAPTQALRRLLAPLARRVAALARTGADASLGEVFGLELEGLSNEDQAFEVARHFVRYVDEAARAGRRIGRQGGSAAGVARAAAAGAARTLAPGLLRRPPTGPPVPAFRRGGAWPQPRCPFPAARPGASVPFPPTQEKTMHDIDRTQMEYSPETATGFEAEQFEFGEGEWSGEAGGLLSEADEYELASELLGVASEEELDQFLGSLIKRAASAAGKFIKSPVGKAIGGVLKGVAKKALPLAGTALGGMVGGPLGAKIGGGLASAAGGALGLEAEAMNQEDQEFEGAKQFVRLAADTVKKTASAAAAGNDPRAAAQAAAVSAARQLAPGLLKKATGTLLNNALQGAGGSGAQSGRWARRGNSIVIYGA